MRIRSVVLATIIAIWTCCVAAGVAQSGEKTEAQALQALEFLVGGTWKAQGEIPGFGAYVAERSYAWSLGGKFIEQHHTLTIQGQKMETRGMLGLDASKNQVVAYGFSDDGGITTSVLSVEGGDLVFQGTRVGGFNAGPIRATLTVHNTNDFVESVLVQQGDQWTPAFSFHWTRTDDYQK